MLARWTLRDIGCFTVRTDDGQDLAEYAILIGLIALVVVGAVTLFGAQLVAMYDTIVSTLPFN